MADRALRPRRLGFAIPGDIDLPTGGYGYDRRVIAELTALGWEVSHIPLPGSFPAPDEADRALALAAMEKVPPGVPLLIDGLAFGVMAREAARLASRGPLVALVHHPLALETGLATERVELLRHSERQALRHAHAVIVTSQATAATLTTAFDVPASLITVAEPGTDRVPFARGSGSKTVRLLTVGSLVPRKGHLELIAALGMLRTLDWELDLVGDAHLDPTHAEAVRETIKAQGLEGRIHLRGALPRAELDACYGKADIFVLASHYEGYGMAYTEALAHGLPVVGTTGGAIADVVGHAAELVPPGDVAALSSVLACLIADPAHRAVRAQVAREAAGALPDWARTATIIAAAVEALP